MKDLQTAIYEALEDDLVMEAGDSKTFFKDFKKLYRVGPYGGKWYDMIMQMINDYDLVKIESTKPQKASTEPMMTVLLSKKQQNFVLDVAVTRPGKSDPVEGYGTANLMSQSDYIHSDADLTKWIKGYRNIIVKQYRFPAGFFDKVRANLGDKLM